MKNNALTDVDRAVLDKELKGAQTQTIKTKAHSIRQHDERQIC